MPTNKKHESLSIAFSSEEDQFTNEFLSGGEAKTVCIDDKKCSILSGKSNANYHFFRNNEAIDKSLPSEHRHFGQCKTECVEIPLLDDAEKACTLLTD